MQHVLAVLIGNITPPMLIAGICGLSPEEKIMLTQAAMIIGDVSSTTMGGFERECTDAELGGAIKGQGLCGMIGACIGGLATDPYSQNVGLICST